MTAADNISLIGMPGAGKSTTGRLLATALNFEFIDTDHLICHQHQRSLQNIVNEDGYMKLCQLEEQVILDLSTEHTVIATGGSAVYSAAAMQHLSEISKIVYLSAPYDVIAKRIKNLDTRGLVKQANQSLYDLYTERTALYEKYADITVDATLPAQAVAEMIKSEVTSAKGV
jgi:shikimate kinase